jgi:hypothetical protein
MRVRGTPRQPEPVHSCRLSHETMTAPRAIKLVMQAALVVFSLSLLPSREARANGAFPDSLQILLPSGRDADIGLATNFGLILSEDGGATWQWTCERPPSASSASSVYAVGPLPRDRIFWLSLDYGIKYSDDDSCTWGSSGGSLSRAIATDLFPDPTDANHVLAIATTTLNAPGVDQVFASQDGGVTFGDPLYKVPADGFLIGVENARSDPLTIYLALYTVTLEPLPDRDPLVHYHPKLVQSIDGGTTWTTTDVEAALGQNMFRIIAVDPTDAHKIYLRVLGTGMESLAVSTDSGATFTTPVTVPQGNLTAFARLASGTVLVGAIAVPAGLGFRSDDGGHTFVDWPGVPHLTGLAERDGKLYLAAKPYTDGWAIGVSTDEGRTIQPLAAYSDVTAIKACAQADCRNACDYEAGLGVWPPNSCCANATGPDACATPPKAKSGCGCGITSGGRAGGWAMALAACGVLVIGLRRGRRRR